jgi:DNA repair protein RadC
MVGLISKSFYSSGIIIDHFHLSGNLNIYKSDSRITQKIQKAKNIMGINLLELSTLTDHGDIFITSDNGLI